MSDDAERGTGGKSGGRPSREAAALLRETILDVATERFLRDGFSATSIEAVAAQARVARRTFHARFPDKATLFRCVVERLIGRWLRRFDSDAPSLEGGLRPILLMSARKIVAIALEPEALALHRIVVAESGRSPELASLLHQAGADSGTARLTAAMRHFPGRLEPGDAASMFRALVLAVPQQRALGLGAVMDRHALDHWAARAVDLFLDGFQRPAD